MRNFNYHQSSEIVFGTGRVAEAGEIVLKYGKRCLMVTTSDEPLQPLYARVKKILEDAGVEVKHFDGVSVLSLEFIGDSRDNFCVVAFNSKSRNQGNADECNNQGS